MESVLDPFLSKLDKLGNRPDKDRINALTAIAADAANGRGALKPEQIIKATLKKIYKGAQDRKVPLMFLVDSIIFNIGQPYLSLAEPEIALLFQETYNDVGDDDKKRLERLLYKWDTREDAKTFSRRCLKEIRARLQPGFKMDEFNAYQNRKAEKQERQQALNSRLGHAPKYQNVMMDDPEDASKSFGMSEHHYMLAILQNAEMILKQKQTTVPEDLQVTLDVVKRERPSLYLEIVKEAQDELTKAGWFCTNASFFNASNASSAPMITPTDVNWDISYLRNGDATEFNLACLFNLGTTANAIFEPQSALRFAGEEAKEEYLSHYGESWDPEVVDLFHEERKLFLKRAQRSRAFLNPEDIWLQDGEEFQQEYSVARTFEKFDDIHLNNKFENQSNMLDPKLLHIVPVDESFPECPITGEPFEKHFDEASQTWVYLNAVRPEPDGPIYNAEAYQRQQATEHPTKKQKKNI